MQKYRGHSRVALKPQTTEQVAAVLQYCNTHKLAVVPQGGNTGLVGGSVPVFDEVVLSTSSMNKIHSLDPNSGVLVCQVCMQPPYPPIQIHTLARAQIQCA